MVALQLTACVYGVLREVYLLGRFRVQAVPLAQRLEANNAGRVLARQAALAAVDVIVLCVASLFADLALLWGVLAALVAIGSIASLVGALLFAGRQPRPLTETDRRRLRMEARRLKQVALPIHFALLVVWLFAWRHLL